MNLNIISTGLAVTKRTAQNPLNAHMTHTVPTVAIYMQPMTPFVPQDIYIPLCQFPPT